MENNLKEILPFVYYSSIVNNWPKKQYLILCHKFELLIWITPNKNIFKHNERGSNGVDIVFDTKHINEITRENLPEAPKEEEMRKKP